MIVETLKSGTRFVNSKLSILQQAMAEDENRPGDQRTAEVLICLANSVLPMIRMEEDFQTYLDLISITTIK